MTKKGERRLVIFLCAAAVILVAAGIVRAKLHPPVRSMSRSQIICTIPAQTQSWNTSLRNMVMIYCDRVWKYSIHTISGASSSSGVVRTRPNI